MIEGKHGWKELQLNKSNWGNYKKKLQEYPKCSLKHH